MSKCNHKWQFDGYTTNKKQKLIICSKCKVKAQTFLSFPTPSEQIKEAKAGVNDVLDFVEAIDRLSIETKPETQGILNIAKKYCAPPSINK